uniref:Addiction module toxin RelE n=1 Tax=Heterorhabditis bacteriophora TaxID=37862 RepID=A0A1I7WB44_HETBA
MVISLDSAYFTLEREEAGGTPSKAGHPDNSQRIFEECDD